MVYFKLALLAFSAFALSEARLNGEESSSERREQGSCDPNGFSKFPNLGRENSERMLLREGAITRIPPSLCGSTAAKNVILVIGDGMGWEMARAGSIAKQVVAEITKAGCNVVTGCSNNTALKNSFAGRTLSNYYTEGKGKGLSFQNLKEYTLVTTGATVIGEPERANHYAPGQSLLNGTIDDHENGMAPLILNKCGFPLDFDPSDFLNNGGNMVLWDDVQGGKYPWDARYFSSNPNINGFNITYIMQHATDSANTAGALATGHKASVGMLSVDLYEEVVSTLVEDAMYCRKSGGVVSSVPMYHATPGAFVTHSVSRNAREILRRNWLAVNPTLTSGTCGSRLYPDTITLNQMRNGTLSKQWAFLEQKNTTLATDFYNPIQSLDPDDGSRVLVCLGGDFTASRQVNLPYRGVDSSYDRRVCERATVVRDPVTNLPVSVRTNSTICNHYSAAERANIPHISTNVMEAIKFLAKDNEGFFIMYEQGDIDWSAHANHMDDMLGTMFDIDDTVDAIMKWIASNGGYERNALYVTADHDHYLTLLPDFPEKLANLIIEGNSYLITPFNNSNANPQDIAVQAGRHQDNRTQIEDLRTFSTWTNAELLSVGHFWGPPGSGGNGWGSHTTRPVPLYYEGDNGCIERLTGKPFQVLGRNVAGVDGKIDQVQLHACMLRNLFGLPAPACVPSFAIYNARYDMWYRNIRASGTYPTPPCAINIEARLCSPTTLPVTIQLLRNGAVVSSRVETKAPYFLFGDSGPDILAGSLPAGAYSIRTIVNGTISQGTDFVLGACFD